MMDIQQQDRQQIRLLLKPREAAQALAISERTLWDLGKNGEIPSITVGKKSIRYPVTGLERYIAEQVEKSA